MRLYKNKDNELYELVEDSVMPYFNHNEWFEGKPSDRVLKCVRRVPGMGIRSLLDWEFDQEFVEFNPELTQDGIKVINRIIKSHEGKISKFKLVQILLLWEYVCIKRNKTSYLPDCSFFLKTMPNGQPIIQSLPIENSYVEYSIEDLPYLDKKGNVIEDEDIVCLSETDACGVDALQVMFKATTGTGSLRINYTGKQAFNIYNRKNGKKARFVLKEIPEFNKKEERMNYILNTQEEELFNIKEPAFEFPEKAKIYNSYICSKCMEKTAENKIEFINNKPVCSQCIKGE